MTGVIFDIREFTVHDGPGTRMTVFLKGCPLRCRWCHNPEGLEITPTLMVRKSACVACGACKTGCDHPECQPHGRCVHVCPLGLTEIKGQTLGADTLATRIERCRDFLTDGGVTFSGGEPLLQHVFLYEVLGKLTGLHRAIETCGYADSAVFEKIISRCELVMLDIKLADRQKHFEYTGVYNDVILKNLEILKKSGTPHIIRVPLIPNITDTGDNLTAIARLAGSSPVELLRYNRAAGAKYPMVGREFTLPDAQNSKIDLTIFQNAKML